MSAPAQSFFYATRGDRVKLARQRYFEEGQTPSGIVSDAVFQSWARCQRLHERPTHKVTFQPVTASRAQLALQKNHHLHQAWSEELPNLQMLLGGSTCAAMLTDATGVLIGATCVGRPHEHLMPIATRLGVNLSEEAVGTTAPGVVARTGQAVCVMGGEHFFESIQSMHCAAAPIRDGHGHLVGVLDISSEIIPFQFDAAAIVAIYAAALENRQMVAESTDHLVVRFQIFPDLIDSASVALVGVDSSNRVAWCNAIASRLLGLNPSELRSQNLLVEDVFGTTVARLASLTRVRGAVLTLPNGLVVWARSEMRARDGCSARVLACATPESAPANPAIAVRPVARDAPAEKSHEGVSLRETAQDYILQTLQECNGNVALTARKLGVSRGLVYRRLQIGRAAKGIATVPADVPIRNI